MTNKNQEQNQWTVEDERSHPSRSLEWWSVIGFFTTQEDQKQWSIKATLSDGFVDKKTIDSLCNVALFDHQGKRYSLYLKRHTGVPLQSRHDVFDVRHGDSSMKGTYPCYEIHIRDSDNDIDMNFTLQAESLPHWVAQEATNGWLPMGLGLFRYGFIPKMRISGTITIQERAFTVTGTGYFEHVWGDFSFRNPFSLKKDWMKKISTYVRLIEWWLQHRKIRIPSTIVLSTENNPFGYDWTWMILENGWTVFYGNSLFWLMQGPAAGIVILSKDGKTFTEFSDIQFQYMKSRDAESYDFVYPSEFEITARKGKETLQLRFMMTELCHEYVSRFAKAGFWRGFVVCESPGVVSGFYRHGSEEISLQGTGKIEPQRQVSVLGHNSLRVDVIKPPAGVGFGVELDSHFFGKRIRVLLQLAPKPMIRWMFCKTRKDQQR